MNDGDHHLFAYHPDGMVALFAILYPFHERQVAVSNPIRCFLRLLSSFAASHSNLSIL